MTLRATRLPVSLDPLIAEAKQRVRRRWLITALIVALLVGGTAAALALRSSGPPGASPVTGPQAVLGSMVAAALGQHAVHWTEAGGEDMRGSFRLTSDVTADSGVERLTIPQLGGKADIRLVNGVVYVKGNRMGLQYELVLPDAQAGRYAGRWISITTRDVYRDANLYTRTADGLTLGSLVHDATSPDLGNNGLKTKVIRRKSHGTRVIVFQEGDLRAAGMTVSAHATGEGLPIAVSVGFGPGSWFGGRFSKWNEPLQVTAPKHAVPIATVYRS